ncbi:MAG TPA: hypothetical protein VJV21_06765 [Pyrinomonadaceae bacterium]|nr:hypothetical protein [Pyrinomonadaceae bacterium]
MRPHRGSTVLVYGILGIVVCQLLAIAAWRMGTDDLRDMEFGQMDPSGRDLTNAGRVLGMVGTGILIFQLAIMLIVFGAMLLAPGR